MGRGILTRIDKDLYDYLRECQKEFKKRFNFQISFNKISKNLREKLPPPRKFFESWEW